jgi:hypothetical protein
MKMNMRSLTRLTAIAGVAVALSAATVTPGSAAPRWGAGAAIGAGAAGFALGAAAATAASPVYGYGYYDYAPGYSYDQGSYDYAPDATSAAPYYTTPEPVWGYYGPANRPGCGAGAPHC